MATRLYFREDLTAPVTPAVDAGWEASGSPFARGRLYQTTGGSLTTTAGFSATAGQDRCHRQWVSEPLAAGLTFDNTVTYKCYVQTLESNADDNATARICVRILSRDGTTVRHTVLAVADYSTGTEFNTALRNKAFLDGDAGTGSYVTVLGDRLVVEVGASDAAGTTPSTSSRWGAGGTADLGENETSTSTTERPWFETSLTLTFSEEAVATAEAVIVVGDPEITGRATAESTLVISDQLPTGKATAQASLVISDRLPAGSSTAIGAIIVRELVNDALATAMGAVVVRERIPRILGYAYVIY